MNKDAYILKYDEYIGEFMLGNYDEETFEGTKEKVLQKLKEMKEENEDYKKTDGYKSNSPFNHHPYLNISIYKKVTEEELKK